MSFRQSCTSIVATAARTCLKPPHWCHHSFLRAQTRLTMSTVPKDFSSVTEGTATILHEGNDVFYNKAQVVNRDISIAVIRWFAGMQAKAPTKKSRKKAGAIGIASQPDGTPFKKGVKGISILEAMAASGLRAIRYAKEIPGVGQVIANDMDKDAVQAIKRNIEFNNVSDTVTVNHGDARLLMLQHPQTFSVVDIDPYGSPTELLDMAVQSVSDGGLMAVTATDMAVLCGNNAEACFTKYGCYSLHRDYNHEQALRILLACLAMHGARHKRVIEPILCLSIDFYIRVFVRPAGSCTNGTKFQVGKGPPMSQMCPISGSKFLMGGPIWSEPIFQKDAVKHIYDDMQTGSKVHCWDPKRRRCLQAEHLPETDYPWRTENPLEDTFCRLTSSCMQANPQIFESQVKICATLRAVMEELPDAPLYYTLSSLTRTLKCEGPKLVTVSNALMNAGYRVSNTHCNPSGLKTDAPPEIVWDIMRCWAKKVGTKPKEPTSYQAKILAVEPTFQADFSKAEGHFSMARESKQPRFVQNPENWGPRPKHGRPMLKHEVEANQEPDTKKIKTS